jgi:hypothetical protein
MARARCWPHQLKKEVVVVGGESKPYLLKGLVEIPFTLHSSWYLVVTCVIVSFTKLPYYEVYDGLR